MDRTETENDRQLIFCFVFFMASPRKTKKGTRKSQTGQRYEEKNTPKKGRFFVHAMVGKTSKFNCVDLDEGTLPWTASLRQNTWHRNQNMLYRPSSVMFLSLVFFLKLLMSLFVYQPVSFNVTFIVEQWLVLYSSFRPCCKAQMLWYEDGG